MIKFSDKALAIVTDKQRETLIRLSSNGLNDIDVFIAFELPTGYIGFHLFNGVKLDSKTPIYGGIDPEGVAST